MANQDSAFGLKPVGKVGQNADNQGMSEYQIAITKHLQYFKAILLYHKPLTQVLLMWQLLAIHF
jgi:hypothetical protein